MPVDDVIDTLIRVLALVVFALLIVANTKMLLTMLDVR